MGWLGLMGWSGYGRPHNQTLWFLDCPYTDIHTCEILGSFDFRKVDKQDFRTLCDSTYCEKLNIRLCKYLLCVGKRTTNAAVPAELGRFPISFNVIEHSKVLAPSTSLAWVVMPFETIILDTLSQESDNHLKRFWSWCVHRIHHKFDI